MLSFAEERAGILVKRAPHALGFAHLSLQEFLAARHLTQLSFEDRLGFIAAHADQLRWRGPILYLFYLEQNEDQVGRMLVAIRDAAENGAHGQYMRQALLTEAVFADFAHDQVIVHEVAEELLSWAEYAGYGPIRDQVISSAVDGLFSESVASTCRNRLGQWLPARHGYSRASVFGVMPNWDALAQRECRSVLLRALTAEEDSVRFAAAEALPLLSIGSDELQVEVAKLIASPPTVGAMASGLRAFSSSWAATPKAGELAQAARSFADPSIAIEAVRIRAARRETDATDLERFCQIRFDQEEFMGFRERELLEYFAVAERAALTGILEERIRETRAYDRGLQSLIGGLMLCDPGHSLIAPVLDEILRENYNFYNLFTGGFPTDKIIWTPELRARAQAFADDEKAHFHDYELYWLAKVLPEPWLKARLVANLQHEHSNHHWSARGLIEMWERDDEAKSAIIAVGERGGRSAASVARTLPTVMHDKKRCRALLLDAVGEGERMDFVIGGFRALGLSQDNEVFERCWRVGPSIKSPAFQQTWRAEMIRTFAHESAVREMAKAEIFRKDGQILAIAESYSSEADIRRDLLQACTTLPTSAREFLVSRIHGAAFADRFALGLLRDAGDDEDAVVSAEAKTAWSEAAQSQSLVEELDIDWLRRGLFETGPDYEQRRAASLIGLAGIQRLDLFRDALEAKGEPLKINLGRPSYLGDDRFLRWMLSYWPHFLQALGSVEAVTSRLSVSAETLLEQLRPEMPYADELYRVLMKRVPQEQHVRKHAVLTAIARFEPRSNELRNLVREWLVGNGSGEFWAGLVAAEIFSEQYSTDSELLSEIVAASDRNAFAVAALAEHCLRTKGSQFEDVLREKTSGARYDIATSFKVMAAVAPPDHLISVLDELLSDLPDHAYQLHLPRWVPALIMRVERDREFQQLLSGTFGDATPSLQVTSVALLRAAGRFSEQARVLAEAEIDAQASLICPDVGFDLREARFLLLRQALETAAFGI